MMRRAATALAARAPRERALLAALVLVVLPLAVWFLGLVPAIEARDRAAAQLVEATRLQDWVRDRDAEFRAATPGEVAAGAVGIAGVEARLREDDLREAVRRLEDGREGRVSIAFDAVEFVRLARFVEGAGALGYALEDLRMDATDTPGLVTASLTMLPREAAR